MISWLQHKAERVLRDGLDADMLESDLHFNRLCGVAKKLLDEENSNQRIAKLICCSWVFSNAYRFKSRTIEDVIVDAMIDESAESSAIMDVETLEFVKNTAGFRSVGRVTDESYLWAFIQLWVGEHATLVSADI